MPKFLDRHPTMPMPPEQIAEMRRSMGQPHDGVTALQFVVGKEQSYCLSEADSADTVRKYHANMGMELGDSAIEEVTDVLP